ncbi:hypothetical protein Tco_0411243 [Tanacetum coccineum]
MEESLPNMVDDRAKEHTKTQVPIYVTEGLIMERKQNQANVAKMIADAIQQEYFGQRLLRKSTMLSLTIFLLMLIHRSGITYNPQLQHDNLPIWLALKIKFKGLTTSNTPCRSSAIHLIDQDDPHEDAHHKGENSAKKQKTSEHRTYVFGESSSGQANESEPGPSTSGNQEQLNDDDEPLAEKVSQELVEEMSKIVDEAKLQKVVDEMRANRSIVSVTKPDYKNLNKNDIEDMYLLCINSKVDDYAKTRLLWSLPVFIKSTVIWERVHNFQLGVESYQLNVNLTAPTNTFPRIEKKKIVLEGLKSYNNDVKYGYVTPSLSIEDVEYLRLFEEEIEERLKHHFQMRRWEMYVNERPLGSRRERLE